MGSGKGAVRGRWPCYPPNKLLTLVNCQLQASEWQITPILRQSDSIRNWSWTVYIYVVDASERRLASATVTFSNLLILLSYVEDVGFYTNLYIRTLL